MKNIGRLVSRLLFALVAPIATSAFAGTYTVELQPANGNVAGPPGYLVGWGYTITNQSPTDWLVTSALNSDPFLYGTAIYVFDFPILDPGASVTVPFNPLIPAGLFALLWQPGAPDGTMNSGVFTVSAEWWTEDPGNGGTFLDVAPDATANYAAVVHSPEAGTGPLLAGAFLVLAIGAPVWRRRRFRGLVR